MAAFRTYAVTLWNTQVYVCRQLGYDLRWASFEVRVLAISVDVCLAGIVKALVDAGAVTDAQLNQVFTAIQSSTFPKQPTSVPGPGDDGTVPPPDLTGT